MVVAPRAMAMKEVVLRELVKEAENTSKVLAAQDTSKLLEAGQSTVLVVLIT